MENEKESKNLKNSIPNGERKGMREIKFRGWHSGMKKMFSCEKMVTDQMTLLTDGRFINVHSLSTELSDIYPPDKFIPLQFTGLKDKNGKEIYEGDIVQSETGCVGVVLYGGLSFAFVGKQPDGSKYFDTITNPAITEDRYAEIIGNIYENPELLEKGSGHEG